MSSLTPISTPAASHHAAITSSVMSLSNPLCHAPCRPRARYDLPGHIQEMSTLLTPKPPSKVSLPSVCLLCCFSSSLPAHPLAVNFSERVLHRFLESTRVGINFCNPVKLQGRGTSSSGRSSRSTREESIEGPSHRGDEFAQD